MPCSRTRLQGKGGAVTIAIVDYGLANIRSVLNAVECFSLKSYVAEEGKQLLQADKIILPGVGSFDAGMRGLHERGHVEALNQAVLQEKIPCLGICLGFQFLFAGSEEGEEPGLGWLKGRVCRFDKSKVKVPHMGWNEIVNCEGTKIFRELNHSFDAYFVHSFYAPYEDDAARYCAGYCEYEKRYVAAIEKDNLFGVQFHPEKSQLAGLKIIENFLNYE